jgi:predicted lipoprotein
MLVRVAGAKPVSVAIQIGPVMRGTALRDASTFIQFSDFTNQSDYAAAATALNDYALRTVIAPLPLETLPGRTVTFIGAVGRSPAREDGAIELVPLRIQVLEAAR